MRTLLYRNFRLLLLSIALIVLWGYASFQGLPRLEDPELTQRAAVVRTFFPGASADRVETLVTEKIEAEIATVKEVLTYESTSRAGASTIVIELQQSIGPDDTDGVWSKVRDKLRNAQPSLPEDATEPELDEIEVRAYALLVGLTWEQDEPPNYAILQRRAQALEDELRALPGSEIVKTFGAPDEEIAVEISSQRLAALGVTAQQIAQQIEQSDAKGAAGQLRGEDELVLEVTGELNSLEQIRQIPLRANSSTAPGSSGTGQFARLGDIAKVRKGIVEPPSTLAQVSDSPAVVLGVFVESGYRLDRWTARAQETLKQFQRQLPKGLKMTVLQEQNRYVNSRLDQLFSSLILGAGVLFIVVMIMMGVQAALAIELTLLLCIMIVLGLMDLMGVPLHQISVTGLIVSLGLLIDNAIIVIDDIQERLCTGQRASAAVSDSIGYLTAPLTAGTLTTVFAFMPIALLPGSIGEFIGTLGLNVILAVSASLFVALTITPVLMAKQRSLWGSGSWSRWTSQGISSRAFIQFYERTLQWSLARPAISILLSLLLPISGFLAARNLDLQFFPVADRDQMQIQIELPPTRSLAQTQATVRHVREHLLERPEIADIHWFIGQSSPRIYYNQVGSRQGETNYANGIVQLTDVVSETWIRNTQHDLDETFPESRILLRWFEQGPPFDAPIELRIYGPDLDVLERLGNQTRALLSQLPEVTHSRSLLGESLPQLAVQIDETAARSRGLSQADIAQQLNTTLEGIVGGSVLEGSEELPVRVRLSNADRASLDQIASLNLLVPNLSNNSANTTPLNATPLNALGRLTLEPQRSAITRRNGIRVNTVQGFIQAGILPAQVEAKFQQQLDESLVIPPGYRLTFGGEAEERGAAIGKLLARAGVLGVLLVATLVLSLGSFRLASIIGVIAILSVGLGLLSEWVWGFPLGFNPIIGIFGLIGIAVNDAITVLTALKSDPDACRGDVKAIRKVVIHATRHVLTTTLTTILGFTPLILGGGAFWPPLAVAIAGGVGGATFLALYLVPALYLTLMRSKVVSLGKSKKKIIQLGVFLNKEYQ